MAFHVDVKLAGRVRRKLLRWYDRNQRDLPWRRVRDPYAVWLSEMMLQQTQVATVVPYYKRFLDRFPTVQELAVADLDEVLQLWAGLGYYARARHMHRAARKVVSEFGGRFPKTVAELRKLPGIGPYSAAAVASIAFGIRTAAVDGNVGRVVARLFNISADIRERAGRSAVEQAADRLLPRLRCGDFNQAMMELGAAICLPGDAARCVTCPIRTDCEACAAGTAAKLPVKARKPEAKLETHVVAAIERDGCWLFIQRPPRGLWGGLWEMPTMVTNGKSTAASASRLARGIMGSTCQAESQPFCDVQHQLTHRTIRFIGHVCRSTAWPREGMPGATAVSAVRSRGTTSADQPLLTEQWRPAAQWRAPDDLDVLAMSKAMHKVIEALRDSSAGGGLRG